MLRPVRVALPPDGDPPPFEADRDDADGDMSGDDGAANEARDDEAISEKQKKIIKKINSNQTIQIISNQDENRSAVTVHHMCSYSTHKGMKNLRISE